MVCAEVEVREVTPPTPPTPPTPKFSIAEILALAAAVIGAFAILRR